MLVNLKFLGWGGSWILACIHEENNVATIIKILAAPIPPQRLMELYILNLARRGYWPVFAFIDLTSIKQNAIFYTKQNTCHA